MQADKIKVYSAYIRVALNNLYSIVERERDYGLTGDAIIDREMSAALQSLRKIENRLAYLLVAKQKALA